MLHTVLIVHGISGHSPVAHQHEVSQRSLLPTCGFEFDGLFIARAVDKGRMLTHC